MPYSATASPTPSLGEDLAVGFHFQIADTVEEAARIGARYYEENLKMFGPLRLTRGLTEQQIRDISNPEIAPNAGLPTIEDAIENGSVLAGPPERIIEQLKSVEERYPRPQARPGRPARRHPPGHDPRTTSAVRRRGHARLQRYQGRGLRPRRQLTHLGNNPLSPCGRGRGVRGIILHVGANNYSPPFDTHRRRHHRLALPRNQPPLGGGNGPCPRPLPLPFPPYGS